MVTNQPRDHVDQALSYLATGLQSSLSTSGSSNTGLAEPRDLQAQLKSILADWDTRYREQTPRGTKTRIHELLDLRNKWAHPHPQEVWEWSDAYRAANSALQLLRALRAKNIKDLESLEHRVLNARLVVVERPLRKLNAGNIAELWLEADSNQLVAMRGALRCPCCKKTINVIVKRNTEALTDRRPRFLMLGDSSPGESQVGHLFVGTILKSPVLYFGAVQHCGDQQRVVAFFNRNFGAAVDPHVVLVPTATGQKNDDDMPF